jgi:mRNA-degrading endonuclease RelE of RelBE toxin-antitoxin system
MRVELTQHFTRQFEKIPERAQKDFGKQLGHLLRNSRHPSLDTKKFDEARGVLQARVNDDYRFYFRVEKDTYVFLEIGPHPK